MGELKSSYRKAVLLWIIMAGGIFISLTAVELCKSGTSFLPKHSSSPEVVVLKYFLLIFTVMTLFLMGFVRSQLLISKESKAFKNSTSRLLTASLAMNLLCETVAITGLTLFFLTRSSLCFYLFMVLSLALFAYVFPRYAQWKEWAGKVEALGKPLVWSHPSLLQMPELHQRGAPAPGLFAGQPEGGHLRDAAQDGMYRSA